MKHILFVELLGGIGDLVMALPSIHGLARSHPMAEVSVFAFRPQVDLLTADPAIARVFPATRKDHPDGTPIAREELRTILERHHFDLIASDANYGGIDTLIESSDAPHKATRLWRQAGVEERIDDVLLRNLVSAGYVRPEVATSVGPRLALNHADHRWAKRWYGERVPAGKRLVLLNPDAGVAVKRWSSERFVTLGKALLKHEDVVLYVVAGEEKSTATAIAAGIGGAARVLSRLPLSQFASIVALASLFISVDTGPAKIAAAVGTPTVALFGPTCAGRYGLPPPHINLQSPFRCDEMQPMNITLQPCWYGHCVHAARRSCTDDIDADMVLEAALRQLGVAPQAGAGCRVCGVGGYASCHSEALGAEESVARERNGRNDTATAFQRQPALVPVPQSPIPSAHHPGAGRLLNESIRNQRQ